MNKFERTRFCEYLSYLNRREVPNVSHRSEENLSQSVSPGSVCVYRNTLLDMSWSRFVRGALYDLREGSDVPDYFGCLIPIVSQPMRSVLLPATPSDPVDDLISVESAPPRPPPVVHEVPPDDPLSEEDDSLHTVVIPPSTPREEEEEEEEEEIQEGNAAALSDIEYSPDAAPPSQTAADITQESVRFPDASLDMAEEEETDEPEPPPARSLASEFRQLDNEIFDRYWPSVTSDVPRLKPNSFLMVKFNPARFNRVKRLLDQTFPTTKASPNSLKFVRVVSF
jgi:hypothetical protein